MLLFETVTANNSQLNSRVHTTLHDPRGFVWMGTNSGLLRYDGYSSIRLQLLDTDHSLILATSTVETITLQNDTTLWIGSSQGLINLNLISHESHRPDIFKKSNVRALLLQNDTCIWVGTNHGLYRFNPESEQVSYFSQTNSGLSQNVIRSIYKDQSGNLWVGTADKLNVLRNGSNRFETFDLKGEYKPDINHNLILDIKSIPGAVDSILLVGTETGLCLFNRYTNSVYTYNKTNSELSNEVVKTIFIKDSTEIYFGTDLGFNKLNLEDHQIENYYHNPFNQYSISNNQIWNISADQKGDLWLATSNGISRLKTSRDFFTYFPVYTYASGQPTGIRVADVVYDSEGKCWIGTSNGLLMFSEQDEAYDGYLTFPDNLELSIGNINTLSSDHMNRLWIGSVAGVNIWDPLRNKVYIPPMDNGSGFRTASNYISSIVPGYDNFFWIGTWGGGLFKAWSSEDHMEDIEIGYVADFNGYVVAGKDYLYALNGNTISIFNINTEKVESIKSLNQQIGNTSFASICTSPMDILWLGTKNQLLKYSVYNDSVEIIQLPLKEDFIITGLIADNAGFIWGCNHNTIFRFDTDTQAFKFFPLSKNIPLKKFASFPFRKTEGGEILVCGYNGFIRFNPMDPDFDNREHPVMITGIKINGTPEILAGYRIPELKLTYENRNIELSFSSFLYDRIGQERYAYMLTGYDESWHITEEGSNSVAYNHLPPGEYVFQIKSATSNPHTEVSTIQIKVLRPFWATPVLLLVYTLLLLFILGFIVYQFISIRKEKLNKELIQAQKERNELINSSKTRFFINISHELLNSIGLITYPLKKLLADREIKDQSRSSLLLIEKNAYFLKAYVDQLLNFRTMELGHKMTRHEGKLELISFCKLVVKLFRNKAIAKGVILKFKSEIKELRIETDEDKLHAILQNLLSNAITFTPSGGQVSLALKPLS
ncbi:MAG: two-component regulator propeller domain-containing protein, partial [Bacteroidota bacterium]|nr:two-component regulator propeller domain-containing protein [Bacteroidota bacterium]